MDSIQELNLEIERLNIVLLKNNLREEMTECLKPQNAIKDFMNIVRNDSHESKSESSRS